MKYLALVCLFALNTCLGTAWAADSAGPLTIDVVLPLSGALANFGAQVKAGVDAAITEANREHPDGVKAVFHDDGCDPARAAQIAQALSHDKVSMVLGHVCSTTSLPASEIYERNHIVMLSAASSNAALTERGLHYTFRVSGRDDVQGRVAGGYIASHFKAQNIGVVYEDDVTGQGHSGQVIKVLKQKGLTPVASLALKTPGDIPDIVAALKRQGVAVVYYGGHQPDELGALLKAAREAGLTCPFVSNDGANNQRVWDAAGGAAEGLIFTFDPDYGSTSDAQPAVAALRSAGAPANGFTLPAYAAAQILIQLGRKRQADPGLDSAAYLHATKFVTALGPVDFDEKGDFAEFHSVLYRWSAGKAAPLPSLQAASNP